MSSSISSEPLTKRQKIGEMNENEQPAPEEHRSSNEEEEEEDEEGDVAVVLADPTRLVHKTVAADLLEFLKDPKSFRPREDHLHPSFFIDVSSGAVSKIHLLNLMLNASKRKMRQRERDGLRGSTLLNEAV